MAESEPMKQPLRVALLIYLLLWCLVLFCATYGLWGAVPPEPPKDASTVATAVCNFLGCEWKVTPEVRQLLLVLFTGAFGATLVGLNSFVNFRGSKRLTASWTMFYVVRPAVGAGVAFAFYLVVRGGFLPGTETDSKPATQFGILAVSVLAGMFSDTAMLKLKEVFETLFKPKDDRPDKMTELKIDTDDLPDAQVNAAYSAQLQASGGTPPYAWSVDPALPAGLTLAADTGLVSGTPTVVAAKAAHAFTVTDAEGNSATVDLELEVI